MALMQKTFDQLACDWLQERSKEYDDAKALWGSKQIFQKANFRENGTQSYSQFFLKLFTPCRHDRNVSRNNFFLPVAANDEVDVAKLLRHQQLAKVLSQCAPATASF